MAYMSFNEGIFNTVSNFASDVKNRVSSNIQDIKNTASKYSGYALGKINDLNKNASYKLHKFGHDIGAAGFEQDPEEVNPNKVNPQDQRSNYLRNLKMKLGTFGDINGEKQKAGEFLKNVGLVKSKFDTDKEEYEELKRRYELEKLRNKKPSGSH